MAVPSLCGPQKCIIACEKFFLFWVLMNIWKDWKTILKSSNSFMLKYSRITVCTTLQCKDNYSYGRNTPTLIFENLKPVEISKNLENVDTNLDIHNHISCRFEARKIHQFAISSNLAKHLLGCFSLHEKTPRYVHPLIPSKQIELEIQQKTFEDLDMVLQLGTCISQIAEPQLLGWSTCPLVFGYWMLDQCHHGRQGSQGLVLA